MRTTRIFSSVILLLFLLLAVVVLFFPHALVHTQKNGITITQIESKARFIVVAQVTEQLGKAVSHLDDIFYLCIRFGYICVLPTFGDGGVALGGPIQFDELFDTDSLPEGLQWVTWEDFVSTSVAQLNKTQVLTCFFGSNVVSQRNKALFRRKMSFYLEAPIFSEGNCSFESVGWPPEQAKQQEIVDQLSTVLQTTTSEVMALFHMDFSSPMGRVKFNEGYNGLQFSSTIFRKASQIRAMYGDYIHLQWRTEKPDISVVNFTSCALAAIAHVQLLKSTTGIAHVYFSADVDRDGLPWSNSLGYSHRTDVQTALELIYTELNVLTWYHIPHPKGYVFDLAVVGVLDRIVAMLSTYFVSGPPECARGGTYVSSISNWREAASPNFTYIRNHGEAWDNKG